jgi:hypothetical protein
LQVLLDYYLTNYVDHENQKSYMNACEDGAILSNSYGTMWASSLGFFLMKGDVDLQNIDGDDTYEVFVDEYENLKEIFDKNGMSRKEGGVSMNGEKFLINSYHADRQVAYLKKNGGGATVAKT